MIKILSALALTIVVPLALLSASYFVSKIPLVQRCLGIDEDDPLLFRVTVGLLVILSFIVFPTCILIALAGLFNAFYGLL